MSAIPMPPRIKLFISHASEDKEEFVRDLANALIAAGFDVWYDDYTLTMGDSLLRKIDAGLRECDFGIVVFSRHFFEKDWTQNELDGLFARESKNQKVILPIWKDVTKADVLGYSPMLAGRLGVPSTKGIEGVVSEIQRAVQAANRAASFHTLENAVEDFASLDREIADAKAAQELAESAKGVRIVQDAAREIIAALRERVEAMGESSNVLRIRIKKDRCDGPDTISIVGSYALNIVIHYGNNYSNSTKDAFLGFRAYQEPDESSFKKREFEPRFRGGTSLQWHRADTGESFTTEQLATSLLKEIVDTFREVHEAQQKRQSL